MSDGSCVDFDSNTEGKLVADLNQILFILSRRPQNADRHTHSRTDIPEERIRSGCAALFLSNDAQRQLRTNSGRSPHHRLDVCIHKNIYGFRQTQYIKLRMPAFRLIPDFNYYY